MDGRRPCQQHPDRTMTPRMFLPVVALLLIAACASDEPPLPTDHYAAIVASPDRSDADRQTDQRRNPVTLLEFTGARPGQKVLDMGAGGGYSTELMARAVGPSGTVYAQDSADAGQRAKDAFNARLKTLPMRNVMRIERPFDDPLPPDVGSLDLITFFFFYHDTAYMDVDRAKMDRRLFDALKPGGILVVADHSARTGDGTSVAKTFHRIEESVVRRELETAGFRFVAEGGFLRHAEDLRTAIVFRSPVPVDEFVLKFQKPR